MKQLILIHNEILKNACGFGNTVVKIAHLVELLVEAVTDVCEALKRHDLEQFCFLGIRVQMHNPHSIYYKRCLKKRVDVRVSQKITRYKV